MTRAEKNAAEAQQAERATAEALTKIASQKEEVIANLKPTTPEATLRVYRERITRTMGCREKSCGCPEPILTGLRSDAPIVYSLGDRSIHFVPISQPSGPNSLFTFGLRR